MNRLLLVEDDLHLATQLESFLSANEFDVRVARDFATAGQIGIVDIDIALVDWSLPDGAGIDLVRAWRRQQASLPIIMLTARAATADRIVGLELGANDYVVKPFEPLELLARIRRQISQAHACRTNTETETKMLERNGITMDVASWRVSFRGRDIELTKMQFQLLRFFLERPNQVFVRDEVLNAVWGLDSYPTTRTVDNHVAQLRQKFAPEFFETVHGVGYRFAESVES